MSHNDSSPDNTRTTLDETKSGTEFANLQQQHEAASPNPVLPNNNNDNNDKINHKKNIPKLASIPSHREAEEMFLAALGGRNEIAADDANNENDSFTVTPRKIRQSINMSNLNNNNISNDDTRSQFTTRSTRSMGGMSSQRGGDFVSGPQNFDYAALSSIMAQGNDTQLAASAGMSQSRSVLSKAREGTLSVERVGGNYGCELVIVKARKGAGEAEEGSDAGFGDDDVDDDFSDTTSRIGGGTDSVFGEYSPNIRRSVGGRLGNEGDAGISPQRQQNNIMNDAEAEAKFRAQQELFKQQSRRYSDAPQDLIEVANDFSMVKKKGSQQDQSLSVARTAEEDNRSEQIMLARRLGQQQQQPALSPSNNQIRKQGSSVASFGNHQDQVVAAAPPPSAVMLEAIKFVEETKKKAAEKRAKELQLQQQEDELQQERNRSVETQLQFAAEEGGNDGESAVKLSLDKLKAHNQQQLVSVENNNNNNNNNNANDYDENAEVPLSALAKPKQPLDAKSAVSRKSVKIIVKRVPKKSKEGAAAANKNDDEIQDQEDVGVIEASPENNNYNNNNNEESSPSARNPTTTDDSNENNSTSISQQPQSNDESSPTASKKKQEKSQKSKQLDDDDVQSIISRATAKGTKIIVVKKVSKNKAASSAAGPNSAKSGSETADADAEKTTIEENDHSNNNKVEGNDEQSQLLQQPAITVSTSAAEFAMIQENETNTKNIDQDQQETVESASSPEAKNPEANQSEKNKQIQEQQQTNENQISPRITEGISGTIVGDTTSNTITNNNNNNPNSTPRFSTGSVLHSKSRHSMGKSKPPAIEPTGDSAHVSISICEGSLHPEHKNYRNAEDFEQDNLLRTQDLDDERERIDREDIANHFAKAVVRNGEGNNINSSRHGSMKFLSSSNSNNNNIADDNCSGKSTPETTTDEAKPASAPAILNSSGNNNNNITSASSSSNLDNNVGSKKENEKAENDGVVDDDVSKNNNNSNNDKIGENQKDEARIPLAEFFHLKKPKNAKNRAKVLSLPSDSSSKFLIDPSKSKSLAPLGIYEPNCSKCHTKSYPPPPHWKCTKTQSGKNCGGLTWQPDQNFCTFCNVEFTLFTRHHHCYLCGKSACDECTAQKECLPSEAWIDHQQTGEKVWNLSDPSAKFRCCKLCFKRKSFDFLPSAVQKKKQVEAAAAAAAISSSPSTNANSILKNLKQVPISPPTFVASQSSFKLIPVSEFGEEHDEQHQVVETETKPKKDDDNDEEEVTRSRIKFVLDETALPSALRKKREDEDREKQKLSQETERLYLNDKDEATVRVFFSEIDETFSFSEIRNFDDLFQLEMEHRRLIKEIRKREVVTINNCYLHHGVVNGLFRGMMERFAQIEEKVRQQDEKQSQQQQSQKKNEKKNSDGDKKKNFPVPGCTIGNFPIMETTKDILSFTGSPKFDVDEISIFGDDFEAVFASRTSMLTRHEEELQTANKELKMNANRLKKMEGCCAF